MREQFQRTDAAAIERYGPGERCTTPEAGDFILTHSADWTSRLVRIGQGLRYRGKDRKYTHWNHAALVVDSDGAIIEALGGGIKQRSISDYDTTEYHLVRIVASPEDRAQEVAFARFSLGSDYGFLTAVSVGLSLLTGTKLSFGVEGQLICSGLVARALERTAVLFSKEPSHIMPADLAKYYRVEPPPPGTPKGSAPKAA